jgi:hypothetical protein
MEAKIVKIERLTGYRRDGQEYWAVHFENVPEALSHPAGIGFWGIDELDIFKQANAWMHEWIEEWVEEVWNNRM